MGEIQIQIPPCSSNYQISKDIDAFLNKQENYIPIIFHKPKFTGGGIFDYFFPTNPPAVSTNSVANSVANSAVANSVANSDANSVANSVSNSVSNPVPSLSESTTNKEDYLVLEFKNKTHTIDNIKGTKLFYLFSRNGECARWI